MYKKHKQASILRSYIDQTRCRVCLRELHTYTKMKAHLYHSAACRAVLLTGSKCDELAPGAGSRAEKLLEHSHDRCLPPLQAAGPMTQPQRTRIFNDIDESLHIYMVDLLVEHGASEQATMEFGRATKAWILEHAISWTRTKNTLCFFRDNLTKEDAEVINFDLTQVTHELNYLLDHRTWDFLAEAAEEREDRCDIGRCHQECHEWQEWWTLHSQMQIPRVFGRQRIILHAFAGRRRLGDIQHYLEKDLPQDAPYSLVVVSLDIVIDRNWGDATREETRKLWLAAIRDCFVVGFIAGPPCETWSRVRGVQSPPADDADDLAALGQSSHGNGLPRVLRTLNDLWGLDSLAIRGLLQILTGNGLLSFALEAIIEAALAGSVGVLEHPAEPTDLSEAASICRLPLMSTICQLPGVERVRFAQGLLGAKTVKATELLCVNLPSIIASLHANRVQQELPKGQSVGKDEQGNWKTSSLKEYAPALCKAISEAIRLAFDTMDVASGLAEAPEHLITGEQLRSMDREFETTEPLRDRNKELPAKNCIIYNI